jgi:hypothetical protein
MKINEFQQKTAKTGKNIAKWSRPGKTNFISVRLYFFFWAPL